ncbi:glycosyltransferase family 4 protein [Winogradskyella echinorum]|uniref:Glycosyltransferase family 4 protein n=1 Tax=Winogradskyella echinorum TaxID=538189 RepID=A0ABR6XXD3_9FLAO|nr:glycosyltransferase family 4 protein [Winogradskyella echinorum]MBC3845167.1 glycosyltransferase family 4 protein [Winogradskyella echinorum]MBC5749515.1 glycosyltransferase family 4 protein [Winogradskyella echinorum]
MKIVHCINSPHIGGIERLVIELAIEQKKQGLDVVIMLDTTKGQYYEYLLSQNIPILESGIKGGFDMSRTTFKNLKTMFNTFQVVHLHSFSPIRSMAAKASNAKVVYTIHGLSKGVRKENFFKYTIRETLKKYELNKVDYFVTNSNSTLSKAKLHYGLKKTKKAVILNGVSIGSYKLNTIQDKEFTIGLVSRFTPRKRIDRLLNAFNLFLKNEQKGRLILVGDGVNFSEIKQLVKRLNLESNVDLVGYSNNVDRYYKQFHVCVQPSDNEGFGLVAVEAYLYGLPILAFNDSGGLKEVIEPLEPENIVNSEAELAERLAWYSKNMAQIGDDSHKRIAYVKNNFSIERMERDYYNVYLKLI